MDCEGELCAHWTGSGCLCELLDLEPLVWHEACQSTHSRGGCYVDPGDEEF
jgi:hypothetical protein